MHEQETKMTLMTQVKKRYCVCISFKTMFGAHKNVKNVLKIKVKCYACVYICYAYRRFSAKYGRLRAYANLV